MESEEGCEIKMLGGGKIVSGLVADREHLRLFLGGSEVPTRSAWLPVRSGVR